MHLQFRFYKYTSMCIYCPFHAYCFTSFHISYSFCLLSWVWFVKECKLLWNSSLRSFRVSVYIIMAYANHFHLFWFYKLNWSGLCTELNRCSFANHRTILSTVCCGCRCCRVCYTYLLSYLPIHWFFYSSPPPSPPNADTKITVVRVTVQLHNL